ncbi:hypothetical protein JCM19992_30990 [Thermostilla marina]
MPKLTIDGKTVEVPPGATILDAAEQLGIEIPTLCYMKGIRPQTSCLVCLVKVTSGGRSRMVPSCGTPAEDGMIVASDDPEVYKVRKTSLELLLSDHVGDCLAPCHFTCPAHMDIPTMLREIQENDLVGAIVTIKQDIALPAILGRVCPKPCEKGCRRNKADGAVAVCSLKRYVADQDLASGRPYLPDLPPDSGKRVAVVGAGPSGLSAAYYLRRRGHAVVLFDARPQAGGRVRFGDGDMPQVPPEILDGEIGTILATGVEFRPETRLGRDATLDELRAQFDAVVLAVGTEGAAEAKEWGVAVKPRGIEVDRETYRTNIDGVFAIGNAIRRNGLVVRSCADGKEVAACVDGYLNGRVIPAPQMPFSVRIGRVSPDELDQLASVSAKRPRQEPEDVNVDFDPQTAMAQAERCFHCDCRALTTCRLRKYAEEYGAEPQRFAGERAGLEIQFQHSNVIYEPGKCISCGLCVEIAEQARAPLGLSFVGRGFDVRIGVPFDRTLEEALGKVAEACVVACPTAALSFLKEPDELSLPVLPQR